MSKVAPSSPQAVYYGGEYPQAGPLSQQMKAGGLNVPLMGGDGIFDPKYIKLAGATSNGDLATSVGAPTDSHGRRQEVPRGRTRRPAYAEPSAAYGGYSYDAANAIIAAAQDARWPARPTSSRPARRPSRRSARSRSTA